MSKRNRPRLRLHSGAALAPGLLAVGLFALMALVVLNTPFEPMADGGFEAGSITAAIGYALFDLEPLQSAGGVAGTEPFLAAFLLIALTLDAALDASLVLAKREESGEPVAALATRGSDTAGGAETSTAAEPSRTATDGGTREGVADGADGPDSDGGEA